MSSSFCSSWVRHAQRRSGRGELQIFLLKLWKEGLLVKRLNGWPRSLMRVIWGFGRKRSTWLRWPFYLRSIFLLFISNWPTALPHERRRGCDTNRVCVVRCIHFPVFCYPGWQMGITSSSRTLYNSNVINQLHPKGSISPALIEVSCSTSSVLFPFFFLNFFFSSFR